MYIAVGTYIYITLVPLCELWEVVLFVVYTLIALVITAGESQPMKIFRLKCFVLSNSPAVIYSPVTTCSPTLIRSNEPLQHQHNLLPLCMLYTYYQMVVTWVGITGYTKASHWAPCTTPVFVHV